MGGLERALALSGRFAGLGAWLGPDRHLPDCAAQGDPSRCAHSGVLAAGDGGAVAARQARTADVASLAAGLIIMADHVPLLNKPKRIH